MALVVAGLAVTSGCGEPPSGGAGAKAPGFDEVRHDEGPVRARFPELGDPERVAWVARPLGEADPRVPGPTDVRMSGVVRLSAGTAESLRSVYAWRVTEAGPKVLPELSSHVPDDASWQVADAYEPGAEASGELHCDFGRRVVVFDAVNPPRATS